MHLSPNGQTSWHGFACRIFEGLFQRHVSLSLTNISDVHAIKTDDYPTDAQRPLYSVLDSGLFEQCFDVTFNDWSYYLDQVLDRWVLENIV